ncbi:MAG: hypothetical protein HW380_281 [Magnetococcales bacterium]|nr:hypothetical protein [Magnetococcales bacterium]
MLCANMQPVECASILRCDAGSEPEVLLNGGALTFCCHVFYNFALAVRSFCAVAGRLVLFASVLQEI